LQNILITGANKGIGLELVQQYSQEGWKVFACCRIPEKAEKLQQLKNNHSQIEIIQLDVSEPNHIKKLADQIQNEPIDILFNNAGVWGTHHQVFGATDPQTWLEVFKVNTIAPQLLAEALINNLDKGQIKIIANMSSMMGSISQNTLGSFPLYRSSKAALNAVTKSLSLDLKDKNIKVVSLHPGWVQTDMGGPEAKISVEESVKGLKKVLSQLSMEDSGTFIGYDGQRLSW
jgi:NAD(P)-dependent dehydrogenase (short-subunit alcohol dehydrogenase family)